MFTIDRLNVIVQNTINVIDKSRGEIFEIAEAARNECKAIEEELAKIKIKTVDIIQQVDLLERADRESRYKLMIVSKNIKSYTEDDIRKAYEKAKDIQIELTMKKAEEQQLIQKRNELERRLKAVRETVRKAESLVSKVGVAMGYLSGGLQDLSIQLEDIKQKQLLGVRIIKAQEEERQRVAREIHDGPAQLMANLVIKTELCEKLVDIDTEKAKEELKNLKKAVRLSLSDVRKIIYDLRPMSLDDLGLIPTMERYISNYIDDNGIYVDLYVFGEPMRRKPIVDLAIFRIAQEALINVRKHACATNVNIRIEFTREFINVLISDNGKGFDKSTAKSGDSDGGYGILCMRERVELLNGKFELNTSLGKGTKIFVSIPLNVGEGD